MIKYESGIVCNPVTPGFEGVTFTVRRFSHGIRSRVRQRIAHALVEIRERTEAINELIEKGAFKPPAETDGAQMIIPLDDAGAPKPETKAQDWTPDQLEIITEITDISAEIEIITNNQIDIVYLEEALLRVEGLEIDGKKGKDITPKLLFDSGPEDLCKEIVKTIRERCEMPIEVKTNLESPTTSGAVAAGQTNGTIAPDVNGKGGTVTEIAVNTSPTQ